MSNKYRDWLENKTLDVLLETGLLSRINHSIQFKNGYLVIGYDSDYNFHLYYIWEDNDWGLVVIKN